MCLMEEITGTPSQNPNPQTSGLSSADRWLLRVRGDVQVEIVDDQGRRIGPFLEREDREEGLRVGWFRQRRENEGEEGRSLRRNQTLPSIFEVSIPGASYKPERTFTSVLLTQPGMYTCKFLGRSASAVDIYLTGFNATTRLDTIYCHGVPISEGSFAQFAYSTYDPPVNLVLTLQDEARREDIPPTAILNPRESQDTLPPRTTISLKGEQVIVSATDNPDGSGVLQTYYTTDAQTFSVYGAPFLPPAEAKIVMAFSIDRNGNREYPGAVLPVLGLSATHLFFAGNNWLKKTFQNNLHTWWYSACSGSNSNYGEVRELERSLFSPSAFPFTLILLRLLLRRALLYALHLCSSCRNRTMQTQPVSLHILHRTRYM